MDQMMLLIASFFLFSIVLGGLVFALVRSMKARVRAERAAAVAEQEAEALRAQIMDRDRLKTETIDAVKAAALSTAQEISSKLLDDHKRESEAAHKAAEERIKKTTENLQRHFNDVVKSVASLNDQVGRNRETLDTVWRALASPGGAGHFAEIGLENTLKSFGLEAGRDFIMQYTITGGEGSGLRPDAVVFLPSDTFLVIDSKASKFLLEIAEVEGTENEDEAYAKLSSTMNQHLRALTAKDYRSAIIDSSREAGRGTQLRRILNVMYLPNEGAVEKIHRSDPDFSKKAAKSEIIIAGPTGLASLIAFARIEIDLGRQAENQEKIVEATQSLLDSIITVINHAEGVGRGIKTAAKQFANFTRSVNSRLLPRSRVLANLGVRSNKNKPLPDNLPAYEVVDFASGHLIEGEAEEESTDIRLIDTDKQTSGE